MSVREVVKTTLKAIGEQLTYSRKPHTKTPMNTKEVYCTNNVVQKAKPWGLSEQDALDVYYHGHERQDQMRCRTYHGYELCMYYGQNTHTGQPYIATIWKRERR